MMRKNIIVCRLASQNKLPANSAIVKEAKASLKELNTYNSSMDVLDHYGKRNQPKNDYILACIHTRLIDRIKCQLQRCHDHEMMNHRQ